jgi:hypothetical protein
MTIFALIGCSSQSAKKNLLVDPDGDTFISILAAHLGHQPTKADPARFRYIRE